MFVGYFPSLFLSLFQVCSRKLTAVSSISCHINKFWYLLIMLTSEHPAVCKFDLQLRFCSSKDVKCEGCEAGTLVTHTYTKTLNWKVKQNHTIMIWHSKEKWMVWLHILCCGSPHVFTHIHKHSLPVFSYWTALQFGSCCLEYSFCTVYLENLHLDWWVAIVLLIIIVEQCFSSAPELHLLVALNFYSI